MKIDKIRDLVYLVKRSKEIKGIEYSSFFEGRVEILLSDNCNSLNIERRVESIVQVVLPPSTIEGPVCSEIKSPLVGTFYWKENKERIPLKKGTLIKEEDIVGYIESHGKLMSEIKSGYSGVLKKVWISNNKPVEYNQRLFGLIPQKQKKA